MWNLEQITTFKLAAETRNFSKVADKLNISAAAVGKQIKTLEDNLGAQLFYRTTRHVALTELGEALYEQCEIILAELEKATDILATYKGKITGKLKIASSLFFGENYLLPWLTRFMKAYPDLTVDLELADRIPNLEEENIDLIVGLMAGLPPQYVCKKIADDGYVLCAAPSYLKINGIPLKPENLTKHIYISHSNRPKPNVVTFKDDVQLHLKPKFLTNSTSALLRCCVDGLGIAIFHSKEVAKLIAEKKLIELLVKYKQPAQPLYLYYKKVDYTQPKIRVFIDFLKDNIQ